ncbi:MAG: two-component regulator propeller domain-containing protein [Chloroflexota bacterium]
MIGTRNGRKPHHQQIIRKSLLLAATIMLLLFPAPAQSQNQSIVFSHITTEHGLSHNSINAIIQDQKGFMWFGTQDGLNRFDGYEFTVYRHDPNNSNSLSDNAIWALYEDQEGMIWIGTNDGLNRFDPNTENFTIYRHDNTPQSLSSNIIWTIHEDKAGMLWIGTDGGGLDKFDRATQQFTNFRHNPSNSNSLSNNRILAIHEDQYGILWIGTWDGGLNKFDPSSEQFTIFKNDPNTVNSISNNRILSIHADQHEQIWIGTWDGGLNKFDPKREQFTVYQNNPNLSNSISSNDVRAIFEDQQGVIWIGTWDGGLDQFDPTNETFTHYQNLPGDALALSSNRVRVIYEDRGGLLWIGTWDGGVTTSYQTTKRFNHFQYPITDLNQAQNNNVRAITEVKDGTLLIGSVGGLHQFDLAESKLVSYSTQFQNELAIPENPVNAIHKDDSGHLWIGTTSGLNRIDSTSGQLVTFEPLPYNTDSLSHEDVTVIYEDTFGSLWIGTNGGGFNRYEPSTDSFTQFSHDLYESDGLNNDFVRTIVDDGQGFLWIGTNGGGLNRLNLETEMFTHFVHDPNEPQSLSSNQINVVFIDHIGTLWTGTQGGGLNRYNPETETFTHFSTDQGLPSGIIHGILEDEMIPPNLWISTDQGLARFNQSEQFFQNFGVQDGLTSLAFNQRASFKLSNGTLVFGDETGLTLFNPAQITNNSHQPPLVVTSFETNNGRFQLPQHIASLQTIELSHQESQFTFEFAALDFIASAENLYAYQLEGFDPGWIFTDAEQRSVTYTNLNPGNYTFRVIGSNNDGIWNETGTAVDLIIHPPPWRTWWAFSLYAMSLVGLILIFVQLQTRAQANELARQRQINETLEQRVVARTRRLETVATLSERLNAILDIDQLLNELVNQVKEQLGYYHAQVYILDEAQENLILKAGAGRPNCQEVDEELAILPLTTSHSLIVHAAVTGEFVIVDNVSEAENWMPDPLRPNTQSEIGVPIIIHEQVVGVLDVQEDEVAALDDSDANLLRSLANQVGVALENAKLYGVAQRELAERGKLIAELDAFSHTVAHDFQNPLSIIMAYAELLGEPWSTEEDLKEASEIISRNGHKLSAIVKELLLLAKMRHLDVALHPLDMPTILAEVQGTLKLMIEEFEAEISIPAEWPIPMGYSPWVEEVWTNYITNAIKYGGRPPKIELGSTILENGMIRFWIRDNGDGLSSDEQAKLFLPFVQLSRSHVEGGYGLGLSIVQRIVEKLGGEVSLESSGKPGQGCMFSFTLPSAKEETLA